MKYARQIEALERQLEQLRDEHTKGRETHSWNLLVCLLCNEFVSKENDCNQCPFSAFSSLGGMDLDGCYRFFDAIYQEDVEAHLVPIEDLAGVIQSMIEYYRFEGGI